MNLFKSKKNKDSKGSDVGIPPLGNAPVEDQHVHDAALHPDAHDEGGLACNNEKLLKEQRDSITAWITSMGKKIFSGNLNLLSTPFPVAMFEPRSYLEKLTDAWVYPRYLQQAAMTKDPVERMKLVVTWFVAGLHHGFERWKKPFNPILGETYQGQLSDGSNICIEQISHHPPVSAWTLQGPGNAYTFSGLSQPNVALMIKYYGFKTVAKGSRCLDFPDGTRIDLQYPGYYIKGVVYSTRPRAEVDGTAILTDLRHGIKAVLRFGPNKGSRFPVMRRTDAIMGEIYDCGTGLKPQPSLPISVPSHSELCQEDSGFPNDVDSDDSEGFETASESDWELRELRHVAEAERDGAENPMLSSRQQRSESKGRLLADAVAGRISGSISADGDGNAPSFNESRVALSNSISRSSGKLGKTSQSSITANILANGKKEGSRTSNDSGLFTRLIGKSMSGSPDENSEVEEGKVVARIEGSWLSHINFDNRRYWTLAEEKPAVWQPVQKPLPSDSCFRQDLVMVQAGDLKGAQTWKTQLEETQRRDKKLREAGGLVQHHH